MTHLPDIQREAEAGLAFARKIRFGLVIDIITSQLRLILTLRGLTPAFNSFNDAQFDEAALRTALRGRSAPRAAFVLVLDPQIAGALLCRRLCIRNRTPNRSAYSCCGPRRHSLRSPNTASTARLRARRTARAISADEQPAHLEALAAHHRQLEIWAHHCPENFGNRTALVGAEIARLKAGTSTPSVSTKRPSGWRVQNGFVQNEGIAGELAARFYAARGFETIAQAYLRNARYCYLRWGADGKVRQLDESYPHLRDRTVGASARRRRSEPPSRTSTSRPSSKSPRPSRARSSWKN